MNHLSNAILLAALAVTLAGCASLNQVRFDVESSSLDYVQFRTTNPTSGDIIRVELMGSGYLERRTGKSSRVSDDFWQHSDGSEWQDLKTAYVTLSQDETVSIFQELVDNGFFDRGLPGQSHDGAPPIAISGPNRL